MNKYQVACKRTLEHLNRKKESGVAFSERRQNAYEDLRRKVAEFEQERAWRMKYWGVINHITFGLVALPLDEELSPLRTHSNAALLQMLSYRDEADPQSKVERIAEENLEDAIVEGMDDEVVGSGGAAFIRQRRTGRDTSP